ncbi:hypothetical protein [Propionicicella superfundia]|nr:hypothetical protein [Propionicicella superfundia]
MTVHVSAGFTASCHDPFAVGHAIVGVGGVFDADITRVGEDHAP